jgi:UDP-N-acetylmuramoyl-L-alanyl-D-glutamate--2,6-diaminopimelate ligase
MAEKQKTDRPSLATLAKVLGCTIRHAESGRKSVTGLAYDSRAVRPGTVFVAIPGTRRNGMDYMDDALQRGAVAVVGESALGMRQPPYLQVSDARAALADLATAFYGRPAGGLGVTGITGTNGKTTTAFMVRAILQAAGHATGLISTVHYAIGDRLIPAERTTPESLELQRLLAQMRKAACSHAVMEVSSHALDQQRVRGIDFDVAVFTNLTPDHLDYHGDMESYFAAKRRLFEQVEAAQEKTGFAVVNVDDAYGMRLAQSLQQGRMPCITYAMDRPADVRASDIALTASSTAFVLHSPWGQAEVRLNQWGRYNVANALAATAAAAVQGVSLEQIVEGLAGLKTVPGRLQPVEAGQPFRVFVDYAHTEDGLQQVLVLLRHHTAGRLWVVVGCGGDRDRSKRMAMGRVAAAYADVTVLTADNPRSEDPMAIMAAMAEGFESAGGRGVCYQDIDRAAAIRKALSEAGPEDVVLLAGKGHETYQDFGDRVIPFDDVEVALSVLRGEGVGA